MKIRIAFSSDNHIDVNRVNPDQALRGQADYLAQCGIQYYFYGGDLFNDFAQTRHYMNQLRTLLEGQTQVYYIAGNHDLLQHAPFHLVETLADPAYLHNRFVDLPGTNWRVIGNNGWYDYSFSKCADQPQRVARWK